MAKDMNNLLTMHNKNDLTTHKAENVTSGNPHGIDAKANKVQEAWVEPTLINGWVALDASRKPMYMKDNFGFVHLKGAVRGGSAATPFFTLPQGYRVLNTYQIYPCSYGIGLGRVQGYGFNFGPVGTGVDIYYLDGVVYKGA